MRSSILVRGEAPSGLARTVCEDRCPAVIEVVPGDRR